MSRHFGSVRQIAFVVRDLPRALRYWTEALGVGPFFVVPRVTPADFIYKGVASPPPVMSLALAFSGDIQVELVVQHNSAPSAYLDFINSGREGLQHLSSWHTREDYERCRARAIEHGVVVLHEGRMPDSGVRFCYFATDSQPGGTVFEMSDMLEEPVASWVRRTADASRDWDGSNPIRTAAGEPFAIDSLA